MSQTRALRATLLLALIGLTISSVNAGESCCKEKAEKKKALQGGVPKEIPDPEEDWPAKIKDPEAAMPAGWDEEDDGPWEASWIDNPKPRRMIPNPEYKQPSPARLFLFDLYGEILEACPWVVLGVTMTAVLSAIKLPMGSLNALLQGETGTLGCVKGALVGLATPLCSCGALPVAQGLAAGGVPLGIVVAFLTASQSAGLDSAAITWGLLGPTATVCRLGGAVFLALFAGMATPRSEAPKGSTQCSSGAPDQGGMLKTFLSAAVNTASEVFPSILVGLALSTLAKHSMPSINAMYSSLQGDPETAGLLGPLFGRAIIIVAALPLQLCEHSTVALAAGIQKAGGSPGLAFAFLLSAPATNLPTLLLLMHAQRSKVSAVLRVAAGIAVASLLLSCAIDTFAVDLLVQEEAAAGAGSSFSLPSWYVKNSPWVVVGLSCGAIAKKAYRSKADKMKVV